MSDELSLTVERVRQNLTARRALVRDLASQTTAGARLGGRMFLAGDRVFDTVTGETGDVVATAGALSPSDAAVTLRFADGGIVTRTPDQLVLRPTLPSAREQGR